MCYILCSIINLIIVKCWLFISIGDGGNDVSMIQAADVGVGLEGKVRVIENHITSLINLIYINLQLLMKVVGNL